jgi:hypothetical protein
MDGDLAQLRQAIGHGRLPHGAFSRRASRSAAVAIKTIWDIDGARDAVDAIAAANGHVEIGNGEIITGMKTTVC